MKRILGFNKKIFLKARKRFGKAGLKFFLILFLAPAITLLSIKSYYGFEWQDFSQFAFYENLANPSVRTVRVKEGLRKEEIAELMAQKLGWDETGQDQFINSHLALNSENLEGRYFPKTYLVSIDDSPEEIGEVMLKQFEKEIKKIKKPTFGNIINEETALKIASLIQREAAGKNDMRLISGIIWNRLFNGMKLQIDATLQYAKGTDENGWWPQVNPKDKTIDSPYNTYLYNALPPSPIANPGLSAIEAAYNPQKTSCLFYLHDKRGKIHCSKTYEEHKRNIERYY